MAPEELLVDATLLFLFASAITLIVDIFKKPIDRKAMSGFSILMLVLISGWFSTDLLAGWNGGIFEQPVNFAYLLVLVVFAAALTRRLSLAFKQASEPASHEKGVAQQSTA